MRLLVSVVLVAFVSRSNGEGLFDFNPLGGFTDALRNPAGALKNATDNFGRAVMNPADTIRDIVNTTSTATNNFTGGVGEGFKNMVNTTMGAMSNVTSSTSERLVDAAKNPLGAMRNLTGDVGGAIGGTFDRTIGRVSQNIGDGLLSVITDRFLGLPNMSGGFGGAIESVVNNTLERMDEMRSNVAEILGADTFEAAYAAFNDVVENDDAFQTLVAVGPALFQAIRPVFSGGSAEEAIERIDLISERAAEGLPSYVSSRLMGPLNIVKIPLKVVSFVQSFSQTS